MFRRWLAKYGLDDVAFAFWCGLMGGMILVAAAATAQALHVG